MARSKLTLGTANEVRELAARLFEELGQPSMFESLPAELRASMDAPRLHYHWWLGITEGLRYCVVSALLLRDPSLFPLVAEIVEAADHLRDDGDKLLDVATAAIPPILSAAGPGREADEESVEQLMDSQHAGVRGAVARGLQPSNPAAIRLLGMLAADADPEVRMYARESLDGVAPVAWWKGKFDADPEARLSAAEAEACAGPLRRLSELLDGSIQAQMEAAGEILEFAGALPPPLARELLRNLVCLWRNHDVDRTGIGAMLFRLPDPVDSIVEVATARCTSREILHIEDYMGGWLSGLPARTRNAIVDGLLDRLRALPPGKPPEEEDYVRDPMERIARIIGAIWPKRRDPTPLALEIVESEREPPQRLREALECVMRRDDLQPNRLLIRLAEAKLAGYPGGWRRLGVHLDFHVTRLPDRTLRRFAERAARDPDPNLSAWGWELLADRLHDPARDEPKDQLLVRLFEDPRTRPAVIGTPEQRKRMLVPLRRLLRAGTVDFKTARSAIWAIAERFGGAVSPLSWIHVRSRSRWAAIREEEPETDHGADLPEDFRGPPTADEWAAYRGARTALAEIDPPAILDSVPAYPPGPWDEADRPVLDLAIAEYRAGKTGAAIDLAYLLASKPSPDAPALLDELVAANLDDSIYRDCRFAARKLLGLPLEAEADEPEPPADDGWGDEDP